MGRSHLMDIERAASDAAFWAKVEEARRMDPTEKVLLGLRLYEIECKRLEDAVRSFVPHGDEASVQAVLKRVIGWRMREETRPCQISMT